MQSTLNRSDLSDALFEYDIKNDGGYMAESILPVIKKTKVSNKFWKAEVGQKTRTAPVNIDRAPGGNYPRVAYQVTEDEYACTDKGLEGFLDDTDDAKLENAFNAEFEVVSLVRNDVKKVEEVAAATTLFNETTFSGYTAGVSTEWSSASGTPYTDILDTSLTLENNVGGSIGTAELCLAVSKKVFNNMLQTTEIKALLSGGNGAEKDRKIAADQAGADRLASILNLNRIFFSNAKSGTADIWDDEYALLFLRSEAEMLKANIQLGRTFLWTRDSPVLPVVEQYRLAGKRSDYFMVHHNSQQKVLSVPAGYLLSNITA